MLNPSTIKLNSYYIINSKGKDYNITYNYIWPNGGWPNIIKVTYYSINGKILKGTVLPTDKIFTTANVETFCEFFDELNISNENYINFLYDT